MYGLYGVGSPAVFKVAILLEELEADYRLIPVNVVAGEQFGPDFVRMAPNNKVPLLVEHDPDDPQGALPLWESGAILLHLAEKTGRFLPPDGRTRADTLAWLFWQASGLSPMAGQYAHFAQYEIANSDYARERYWKETNRLFAVLNRRLRDRDHVAGAYSIADMACHPWVRPHRWLAQDIDAFPDLKRWLRHIGKRPAVIRAYARIDAMPVIETTLEDRFAATCGHDASVVT
jgi:GSH-dependent disulfide-bond oxidoreductase